MLISLYLLIPVTLVAPDSGANTREKIKNRAAGATGAAKDKILEGLDMLEAALEEK